MAYIVPYQVYSWLHKSGSIVTGSRYNQSGQFELDSKSAQELLGGFALIKTLKKVATETNVKLNDQIINSAKNSTTLGAKLYNWNILAQGFQKVGFLIAKERIKQITVGNFQVLVSLLEQMASKFAATPRSPKNVPIKAGPPAEVNDPQSCKNIQELLSFLLRKSLQLNHKQALAALSDGGQFFAHVAVKGLKGSYQPVLQLIDELKNNLGTAAMLCEVDKENSIKAVIGFIKPAFISRDSEVALAGSELLGMFVQQLAHYKSGEAVYDALSSNQGGFEFLAMGLKRHPSLATQMYELGIYPMVQHVMHDFFEVRLKQCLPNLTDYLRSLVVLLPAMTTIPGSRAAIKDSGLLAGWVRMCEDSFSVKTQLHSDQCRLLWLEVLCDLWKPYSTELSTLEAEELLLKGIQELKRNTRKTDYTIKIPSLIRLFDFLQYLASRKSKLAALVYRKIIFLFVENHEEDEARQVILQNLGMVLEKFPSIPVEVLTTPFMRQLTTKQGSTYVLNLFDFTFILQLSRHPKLPLSQALSILQYFAIRVYPKSVVYSKLILEIIQVLVDRFALENEMVQSCITSSVALLNAYGVLSSRGKSAPNEAMIDNQKRSLIIELLKVFLSVGSAPLSENIRDATIKLHQSLRQNHKHTNRQNDKGLLHLLSQMGDPEDLEDNYNRRKDAQNLALQQEIYNLQGPKSKHAVQKQNPNNLQNSAIVQSHAKLMPLTHTVDGHPNKVKANSYRLNHSESSPSKLNLALAQDTLTLSPVLLNSHSPVPPPSQKVLEDIQAYKEKAFKQRKQIQQQQLKILMYEKKIDPNELLQRNISLGYSKLPETMTDDKLLFDFDSVRQSILKVNSQQDTLQLDQEEDRDKLSVMTVIQGYSKQIKSLFSVYSKGGESVSFTDLMRMLKEANLNRVSKHEITSIVSSLNRKAKKDKNLLGGLDESEFGIFLIFYAYAQKQEQKNIQDVPMGFKVQQLIYQLISPTPFKKDLNRIRQFKANPSADAPQGFKKVKETVIQMDHALGSGTNSVSQSYVVCLEVLNAIFRQKLNISLLSPQLQIEQSWTIHPAIIRKIPTAADAKSPQIEPKAEVIEMRQRRQRSVQNSNQVEDQAKKLERIKHMAHLKEELERMRKQKAQKISAEQSNNTENDQKKRKKEELRKKYLQENKEKLEDHQKVKEKEIEDKKRQEAEEAKLHKEALKEKQKVFLSKEMDTIRKKAEARQQKRESASAPKLMKEPKAAVEVIDQMRTRKEETQKREAQFIEASTAGGSAWTVVNQYRKPLTQLYQAYWAWETQLIDLKGIAKIMKDFGATPEPVNSKVLTEVYKSLSKGSQLDFDGFISCITRATLKSFSQTELNLDIVQSLLTKLEVEAPQYGDVIRRHKV